MTEDSHTPQSTPPGAFQRIGLFLGFACLLASLTWLLYRPSLNGPFVFDDLSSITMNASLRSEAGLRGMFSATEDATTGGRPLLNASLAMTHRWVGESPRSFRLVNMVIHVLNGTLLAVIIFVFLRSLDGFSANLALFTSMLASLLWTIHPMQVTSVSYVIQRAESQATLCYLISILCGWSYLRRRTGGLASLVCAGLALLASGLTKEIALTAPLTVTLMHGFVEKDRAGIFTQRRWQTLMAVMGAALIPVLILYLAGGREGTAGFGYEKVTEWEYFRTQHAVVWHYLRGIVWPFPIAFDYGWPKAGLAWSDILYSVLYLTGLAFITVGYWGRRAFGLCALGFWIALLPTSSFIPINDFAFDHRCYLGSAWILSGLAVAAIRLLHVKSMASPGIIHGLFRVFFAVSLVLAVTTLAIETHSRNRLFSDAILLWQDTALKRPGNARAYNNLGVALAEANRRQEAYEAFQRAAQADPEYPEAWNNAGLELVYLGQFQTARDHFARAVKLNPKYHPAFNNLGTMQLQLGLAAEAVQSFEAACALEPESADYHERRAAALQMSGATTAANEAALKASQLRQSKRP